MYRRTIDNIDYVLQYWDETTGFSKRIKRRASEYQ
jgi:hypothetical protein